MWKKFTKDNLEHKNERPWPNPRLKTASIVGHTTTNTCRLWVRTGREGTFTLFYFPLKHPDAGECFDALAEVPFDPQQLPANTISEEVTVRWATDTTVVFDLDNLSAKTSYQYVVADLSTDAPRIILGQDIPLSFQTLPEKEKTFSFALYSCHMPYKKTPFDVISRIFTTPQVKGIEMWDYLNAMLIRHRSQDLRFVLAGGDQVYTDGVDDLNIWRLLNSRMRKKDGQLYPDEQTMQGWYRDIYRGYWGFPQVRRVFSNFPMYMMWDDHELMDGWGSRYLTGENAEKDEMPLIFPSYEEKGLTYQDCRTMLSRMESAAKAIYEEYQHAHNPVTEPGVYDYGFLHDRAAFYMLDGRGNRDINRASHRILGKEQLNRFRSWVEELDSEVKFLFVNAAVPVLHVNPLFFKPLSEHGEPIVQEHLRLDDHIDDIRDAWEHPLHAEERKALLEILFAAAKRGLRVCILSGDVHAAAAFRMIDPDSKAMIYQLTSSAITYNTPRFLSWTAGLVIPDKGKTSDGYKYKRLARYIKSNFSLIKVDQEKGEVTFQIYGEQETEHPSRGVAIPMTHSLAKLELRFD